MSQARVAFSTTAISSRSRADQPRDRVVGVLDAVRAVGGRLVAADLAPRARRWSITASSTGRGRQRRAGVVEVGDRLGARRVRAGPGDVDAHGLRAAIIRL